MDDLFQRIAGFGSRGHPFLNLLGALLHRYYGNLGFILDGADHGSDFRCRFRVPLCQFPHFVGNYSKSAALLSGACRLNSGIQGKQVGLIGNIIDHADNAPNLIGALAQFFHFFGCSAH